MFSKHAEEELLACPVGVADDLSDDLFDLQDKTRQDESLLKYCSQRLD